VSPFLGIPGYLQPHKRKLNLNAKRASCFPACFKAHSLPLANRIMLSMSRYGQSSFSPTLGCFSYTRHPEGPAGKRVLSLDVGLLVAGAKERGELESRVTNILSECREAGNVILMCADRAVSPTAASCRLD